MLHHLITYRQIECCCAVVTRLWYNWNDQNKPKTIQVLHIWREWQPVRSYFGRKVFLFFNDFVNNNTRLCHVRTCKAIESAPVSWFGHDRTSVQQQLPQSPIINVHSCCFGCQITIHFPILSAHVSIRGFTMSLEDRLVLEKAVVVWICFIWACPIGPNESFYSIKLVCFCSRIRKSRLFYCFWMDECWLSACFSNFSSRRPF